MRYPVDHFLKDLDHDLLIPCRCYLGVSGLVAVGMGVIVALSLTMLAGFPYNGIHGTVPFIALGMLSCQSNMNVASQV